MVAFVVVVAVAVAAIVGSTDAAPQNVDGQTVSIGGQSCDCVIFYMCEKSNVVDIPEGSSETGCSNGLTCCRSENGASLPAVSEPIATNPVTTDPFAGSSESPPMKYTEDPINVDKPQKCTCVPKKQCLNSDTNDDNPDIDIRFGCVANQVCCEEKDIKSQNTQKPYPDGDENINNNNNNNNHNNQNNNNHNNNNNHQNNQNNNNNNNHNNQNNNNNVNHNNQNNNDRSCGVGMPPSKPGNLEVDTRIVITSEEKSRTYFGQFPWMVAILKTFVDETTHKKLENVFQCGGSLIHPQVVLTAAHCVSGIDYNLLKVRVGEWDTQSNDNDEEKSDSHQDIGVSKIIIHQHHNNASMFNDVALIKLNYPYEKQPHINVICIPDNEKQVNYDPNSCVSTGWGKDGFKKIHQYQDILKKVELSLVPNDVCQYQLRKTRLGNIFRLHESFICAGGVKGVDACQGDGGGPLFCAVKGEHKKYIQVGIVSWGIGCGDDGVPGVYASVVANSKWINEHLQKLTK